MGLSNKTLIALASVAVSMLAIAFMTPGILSTGMSVATVNVSVDSTLEVNFSTSALDFGPGYISDGSDRCLLGTNTTTQPGCGKWESKPVGLVLENIGNVYARINITNTNYSSSFFAGSDSDKAGYAIIITTPEGNSTTCQGVGPVGSITESANHTWYNLTQALNTTNLLCGTFNFSDLSDTVQIDFQFSIPSTTNLGAQADTWTATAKAA